VVRPGRAAELDVRRYARPSRGELSLRVEAKAQASNRGNMSKRGSASFLSSSSIRYYLAAAPIVGSVPSFMLLLFLGGNVYDRLFPWVPVMEQLGDRAERRLWVGTGGDRVGVPEEGRRTYYQRHYLVFPDVFSSATLITVREFHPSTEVVISESREGLVDFTVFLGILGILGLVSLWMFLYGLLSSRPRRRRQQGQAARGVVE